MYCSALLHTSVNQSFNTADLYGYLENTDNMDT